MEQQQATAVTSTWAPSRTLYRLSGRLGTHSFLSPSRSGTCRPGNPIGRQCQPGRELCSAAARSQKPAGP